MRPRPYPVLQRIPDAVSYAQLIEDVHAAHLHTFAWVITGNTQHADKAVQILNGWSSTLTSIPSTGDPVLAAGLAGYQMAAAAETLRATYPAWQAADQQRLRAKLVDLFYPPLHNFLIYHEPDGLVHSNTGVDQHFYTNWDAAAMVAIGAIGVFADDRAKYQEAVDSFSKGTGNGAIFRAVWDANTGQVMEAGRDPEHAQLGIGLLATLCEIAWNQGEDLYGYDSNRLLKGMEYMASYLLGNTVPFATYSDPFRAHTMISQESTADRVAIARANPRPIYEMVWNHYVQRRNVPAPFTQQIAEKIRPEGFRADHIGYGTLLFSRESAGTGGSNTGGAGSTGGSGAGAVGKGGGGAAGAGVQAGGSGGATGGTTGTTAGAVSTGGGSGASPSAGGQANFSGGQATSGAGAVVRGGATSQGTGGAGTHIGAGGTLPGLGGAAPGGFSGSSGSGAPGQTQPDSASGCGCRSAASKRPSTALGLLSALGLCLALRRRPPRPNKVWQP